MKTSTRWASVLLMTVAFSACDGPSSRVLGQESWETDFSKHTVPLDEIVSGGPPKDGIPAIDDPKFESVDVADDWLDPKDPVAVVSLDGETKAYPLGILIRHEIVNDRVGDRPVSVTYCPLCNTTLAFDRRFDGKVLDFGTTGRLRHSDLVMYDRQTETWWQQATGEGIVGHYAGEELDFVAANVLAWGDVKSQHPDARVLSRDTGYPRYRRSYGQNPYEGYDRRSNPIAAFFSGQEDNTLPKMERIVALDFDDESMALPFSRLAEHPAANVDIAGRELVVFWKPGTASAVDARDMSRGRDVGSSAVYRRTVDGRTLTFEPASEDRFRDRETGSIWNISGQAVEGELEGEELVAVPHGNHFWFAWAAFKPDTEVWEP